MPVCPSKEGGVKGIHQVSQGGTWAGTLKFAFVDLGIVLPDIVSVP